MKTFFALCLALVFAGSADAGGYRSNGFRTFNSFNTYGGFSYPIVSSVYVSPVLVASPVIVSTPITYATPVYAAPVYQTYSAPIVTYSVPLTVATSFGYSAPFSVNYVNGSFYHGSTGAVITGQFATHLTNFHNGRTRR